MPVNIDLPENTGVGVERGFTAPTTEGTVVTVPLKSTAGVKELLIPAPIGAVAGKTFMFQFPCNDALSPAKVVMFATHAIVGQAPSAQLLPVPIPPGGLRP